MAIAQILIVEDDQFFREAIRDLLKKKDYDVLEAPNGKTAKDILVLQMVDLVISDIQMPGLSGMELLEWSKEHKPVPFIIMTGFSKLLETQSAYDLGAREFLTKPFKNIELLEAIERIVGRKPDVETKPDAASDRPEYCKVSIDDFVARTKIDFDVYVRLSENKHIKISNQGEGISTERVNHYKSKGLRYLYIRTEDFRKIVDFNLNLGSIIKNRADISDAQKINFMKYTSEVILEKAFVEGVDKFSFNDAKVFLNMTSEVISEAEEHFDLLNLLNSHSDYIYAHSFGVAMYAVMIARNMGIQSNQTLFKLSMAALFHDIGKKEIDRTILEKQRALLTTQERTLIESHVSRGKEILMTMQNISEEIVQIVFEHHEDCAGQGYPLGKAKKDLHPLSKILQVANLFVELAMKGPNHSGIPGPSAVAQLERLYFDRLDGSAMRAVKALFQIANVN